MRVKFGLLYLGKNICWGCSRVWRWGRYLDLSGREWQNAGENCLIRIFIICISRLLLRWWKQGAMGKKISRKKRENLDESKISKARLMAHNPDQWRSSALWIVLLGDYSRSWGRLRKETGGQIDVVEALYLIQAINLGLKLAATTSRTISCFQVAWGESQLAVITH